MNPAEWIFWSSLAVSAYVWAGYPLLLFAWRAFSFRPVRKGGGTPTVSVIVAMRDESELVDAKVRNLLASDYPADRFEIIFALDGASAATRTAIEPYVGRITVVELPEPRGKAAALNSAVARARGEVLLMTDVRQRLARNAITELAGNFDDPLVGAVSGELVIVASANRPHDSVESIYWRYEKTVRRAESGIHSLPGATGAIYAIRRRLFSFPPEGTILDDVAIPMGAVLAGYRCVMDFQARAFDRPFSSAEEYRRKVRTLAGNYQLVAWMPQLVLPWRNPIFLQFVSHKLGRLVVPYCLVGLFVSNLFLQSGVYLIALYVQIVWYALAMAGFAVERTSSRRKETGHWQESEAQ